MRKLEADIYVAVKCKGLVEITTDSREALNAICSTTTFFEPTLVRIKNHMENNPRSSDGIGIIWQENVARKMEQCIKGKQLLPKSHPKRQWKTEDMGIYTQRTSIVDTSEMWSASTQPKPI